LPGRSRSGVKNRGSRVTNQQKDQAVNGLDDPGLGMNTVRNAVANVAGLHCSYNHPTDSNPSTAGLSFFLEETPVFLRGGKIGGIV